MVWVKPLIFALAAVAASPTFAVDVPVTKCDRLGASPDDLDRPDGVAGVAFTALDATDDAVIACIQATTAYPSERRLFANLGRLYYKRGAYFDALAAYRLAHGRGSAVAANNLGAMYQSGHAVAQSEERATFYFRKAAHRGLAYAMRTMGTRARTGTGIRESLPMAAFWYQKAADAGDAVALHDLGVIYQSGMGVREDDARAFDMLSEALERDPTYALAAYNIAAAYETGEGVDADLERALSYYEMAAENGDGDGANEAGRFYADGLIGDRDPVKAAEWYARGAGMGSMAATVSLADAYHDGLGVAANAEEAERLYIAALDFAPNEEWRTYIAARMEELKAANATE